MSLFTVFKLINTRDMANTHFLSRKSLQIINAFHINNLIKISVIEFLFLRKLPCFYYNTFSRFVNINKLYLFLLSLNRRLIACCCLSRLTASVSGCSRPVGLVCKPVFLTVAFKLLLLLLELIIRLVKTLFISESVKRGTFTL